MLILLVLMMIDVIILGCKVGWLVDMKFLFNIESWWRLGFYVVG